jgi:hypothetical protein
MSIVSFFVRRMSIYQSPTLCGIHLGGFKRTAQAHGYRHFYKHKHMSIK